jgi:hypothetical protein
MHPVLSIYLAEAINSDRRREAERFRRARPEWAAQPDSYDEVTVRRARPSDAEAVQRLAELDGRRPPNGAILVAEVRGELLAVRSVTGGRSIADPFHPTAHLIELLELRSAHLRNGSDSGHDRRSGARRWLRAVLATNRS